MYDHVSRRHLLRLAGIGSLVLISGLMPGARRLAGADVDPGPAAGGEKAEDEFYFLQLTDTHIGFNNPKVNPDGDNTLVKAIAGVNALKQQPDFIVFSGDLTHTTDDTAVRNQRMQRFQEIVKQLQVQKIYYLPGEHDAAPDQGAAFIQHFGPTHYSFDHKGVHFIALDNVSDPGAIVGPAQLAWLKDDLGKQAKDARIVVFTHRPLFDLFPQWDWATRDGQSVIDALTPYANVTVFYGHIHQEHHFKTGHIEHHAGHGLMYALPAPGSVPKKAPVAWDPSKPYLGLGYREIEANVTTAAITLDEHGVPVS
jgi:hypothetical protein